MKFQIYPIFFYFKEFEKKRGIVNKVSRQVTIDRSNVRITLQMERIFKNYNRMLKLFRCYGDSSSDNESIKEAGMAYFTKNLGFLVYKDGKNHMDASNDIQYSIGSGLLFRSVLFLITFLLQNIYIEIDTQKIDIDLLRKLFNGKAITEINANQCSTIISKGSRTKNVCYAR
ncbi:hypothetical protein RIR_jg35306.t3 [Rhizophagus irregularis DAOM 181602=DAOM 197198]|nr:hypothetical protein RIR_jg35306.t3 [Rhizophagus irregularis DAOM 181602=DAOM 197198]